MTDPIKELIDRAKAAGIEVEEKRHIAYLVDADDPSSTTIPYIHFPNGKETRSFGIFSNDTAKELLSLQFEDFTFIGDYDAIADLEKGSIEAAIRPRDAMGSSYIWNRLGLVPEPQFSDDTSEADDISEESTSKREDKSLFAEGPNGNTIEISLSSPDLQAFSRPPGRQGISLRINLKHRLSYSEALSALETLSNSVFFQIEMDKDISLSLKKSVRRRNFGQMRARRKSPETSLQYPSFEYDSAPISLYWYAKSARGMPLLQFLAYYQVAEYYFPNFSKLEAVRNARKLLKHPSFRIDRESDLTKLVSSIAGNGRGGSSEREQMRATVLEVLSLEDVNLFMEENEDVAVAIGKKQPGVTDKTVNFNRKGHDHRVDIAELLYDIRCRIVHAKNDAEINNSDMILPYSSAEEKLWSYISLMKLVARHALIRSSSVLSRF